jgi:hypothetical protein
VRQSAVADLTDVELQRIVRGRPGEARELARRRGLVDEGRRLLVRRVEEMLGCVAFHSSSIGRTVAPLEG